MKPAIIYDGECRVCGKFVRLVRRWDRRGTFELLPYQDPAVMQRFPQLAPAALAEALHVVEDGRTWIGAAAVDEVLRRLPAGCAVSWLFRLPGAERAYRAFARNRYRFGCGDHCRIG